jgi:uncharacterized membrane protein
MHFFAFILFKILFFAFFITMIILITRKRDYCRSHVADPMTILETRFVNGEINRDEFEKIKTELKLIRKNR